MSQSEPIRWEDQPEDELESFRLYSPHLLRLLALIGRSDVGEDIRLRAERVRDRLRSGAFQS